MKQLLISLSFFLCFYSGFAQEDSPAKKHDAATDNIADVLFNTRAKPIRDRLKSFENGNGIKIQYRVENQSLDKLGGLSEHLFKLFQTFTSMENVNSKVITAEFSALQNTELSDVMSYKTNATSDLTQCRLPLSDTQHQDSLYNKYLQNGVLTFAEQAEAPENIEDLCANAIGDYEKTLYKHADCPDVFNSSTYNQHVLNTRQNRFTNWAADAGNISLNISANYANIVASPSHTTTPNNGTTKVNLFIDPNAFAGHYITDLANCLNECTESDLEVRCRMLYNKTGIHYLFITKELDYYLPIDSANKFRDAAVKSFSANLSDNIIIGLYLKMKDGNSAVGTTLLIKQLNGTWLTQADIAFATYNNGGSNYESGTFSRFNNIFKNIPKPLILCYQVAKVNGLLTTTYFDKGTHVKGKEQIYVHVFKLDKAFNELKNLYDQRSSLIASTGGSGGSVIGTSGISTSVVYDQIALVENKIKIAYVKAAKNPQFMDADLKFKDQYLQDGTVVQAASLKHLQDNYGFLFKNNAINALIAGVGLPTDLKVGTCKTGGSSDVIADGLNIASLLLSPTGLDFIPDALAVAYYASNDQLSDAMWASAGFLVPGVTCGAKKIVASVSDAIREMNAGSRLIKEGADLKAVQQDKNLMSSLFNIHPENMNSSLSAKINDNPAAVNDLLLTTENKAKLYSNVSLLGEAKRVEFLQKSLDEPNWRQKVLDDPDEVLWWGADLLTNFKHNTGINAIKVTDNTLLNKVKSWQGSGSYPGVDEWEIFEIPAGTRLYGGVPGQSEFYSVEHALESANFNKTNYWTSLQVSPHPQFGYREKVGEYIVNEPIKIAVSRTLANPQHGSGGAWQIFVENYTNNLSLNKEIALN